MADEHDPAVASGGEANAFYDPWSIQVIIFLEIEHRLYDLKDLR